MLINKSLANKKVATEYGLISFNDKGESKDLTADQEKKLAKLAGFSLNEGKKAEDEAKKEEKKEEKPKQAKGSKAKK